MVMFFLVCVCVCVCEREREKRESVIILPENYKDKIASVDGEMFCSDVDVFFLVCVWERERECEFVWVCFTWKLW